MLHLMINWQTSFSQAEAILHIIKSNVHERYLVGGMYTYTYHQSLAVMIVSKLSSHQLCCASVLVSYTPASFVLC